MVPPGRLGFHEEDGLAGDQQRVVEKAAVVDLVLARHAVQVLGVPAESLEHRLHEQHLGVRLVHRPALKSAEDFLDRLFQRRHRSRVYGLLSRRRRDWDSRTVDPTTRRSAVTRTRAR